MTHKTKEEAVKALEEARAEIQMKFCPQISMTCRPNCACWVKGSYERQGTGFYHIHLPYCDHVLINGHLYVSMDD